MVRNVMVRNGSDPYTRVRPGRKKKSDKLKVQAKTAIAVTQCSALCRLTGSDFIAHALEQYILV